MKEIVKLKDVWAGYDNTSVLEGINLTIGEHNFLGIIGPNGGGKTTLLKVMLGLIKPFRGEVKIFDQNPEIGRKFIGYVPQYREFNPDFPASVWDIVLMGRMGRLFKRYNREDRLMAEKSLETVKLLNYRDKQISTLSGGQQQRVLIARALVSNPKLLLMDEPTASVDSQIQRDFYELLDRLKAKMSIVLVSHDLTAVSTYVDKIACLNHKLFYHNSKEISGEEVEEIYKCPVELIAHGVPHRVLKEHKND